jgi:protein-S-isoprenylcysteine O-methyltransferase Ste14
MNNPAIPLSVPVSLPVSEPPRAAPRRRSPVERLRKPASWLAIALIGWLWLRLEPEQGSRLVFAAELTGFVAVMAAVLGRVWCALYIAGRKNAELCQDGPYSLVRNPLYVFSFVGSVGVAIATLRWPLAAAVALLFLAYYHAVMRSEEARLKALFPATYPEYCRRVPRFFPRWTGFSSRSTLTLVPGDVTRAMREVVWFPVAFAAVVALNRIA